MAADLIGVVVGENTGRTYAVITPDDDRELDNPCWCRLGHDDPEALVLVKITRPDYAACRSQDDLDECVKKVRGS
jgi:hypothetical protein